ncbi:hypothetical protein TELCIR_08016 [Teladorsagia circumcincta]|uniref:ET module n=1 Tax=Teladorsagia circumcincta TaxID=45464 RepID=A0A2G9UIR6_TELCI|nr:hypothetical protein TELCIR_08016 [Teladorsagia circumcincta]
MSHTKTLLIFLLGTFAVTDGIKCIYGADNGWKGWHPKIFQENAYNRFCLNITMPIDVGNSTLFLSDVFNRCTRDGCFTDKNRTACCCSYDLCNSTPGYIRLLFIPFASIVTYQLLAV